LRPIQKTLRWLAPLAITTAALVWVFQDIDFQTVAQRLTPQTLATLIPALLVFAVLALAIEAECLVRLLPASRNGFTRGTAARIKAASYPLALIHYALGAGALAVLLNRRTRRGVGDAAGIVGLISLYDIGIQLLMLIIGVTALETRAADVRVGVAIGLVTTIGLGFLGLRTRVSLGPLNRLRELSIFDAARTTPLPKLVAVGCLRVVFALVFVTLVWICCMAFDLRVPWSFLLVGVPLLIVVAMIPSVAGLGTGQIAFVSIFARFGDEETLLACSLAFSTGLIVLRAGMGLVFAREFTREAFVAARQADDEAAGDPT
jgi:hypothetical protein